MPINWLRRLRFRKRLYISAELRNILICNLGFGGISFFLDIYGMMNLSLPIAILGFLIGFFDFLTNMFLLTRYVKSKRREEDGDFAKTS